MSAQLKAAQQTAAAAPLAAVGWMVLAIDELHLALPQREVRKIELLADLEIAGGGREIAWLRRRDAQAWPAYNLDARLELSALATSRRVCVFVGTGDRVVGIACDRLWSLASDAELMVEPVPGCMIGRPSPIRGFARYRDGIAAVAGAGALQSYLDQLR